MQIGSRTPSGIGLGSGGRLRRMRQRLVLPRELWIENFGKSWSSALERKGPMGDVSYSGSGGVGGVGDCPRLVTTEKAPRETSGPRIDRIPPTRPPWWRRQYREHQEINFFGPQYVSH